MQNSEKKRIPMYNNRDSSSSALQNFEFEDDWGVDKIGFSLQEDGFSMPKDLPRGFQQKTTTKWDTIDRNRQLTEKKYIRNTLTYNLTIQSEGAICHFNPSKILHPFRLLHEKDVIIAQLGDIQTDLKKECSYELNIEKANAYRIDLAKNIILKHDYEHYTDVINTFQGKRQIKAKHDDSFYWRNKSNEYTIYNKYRELQNLNENIYTDNNFMRGEVRIKNSQCVDGIFKTKNLLEIIDMGRTLKDYYNNFVNDRIFRKNQYIQKKIEFGDLDIMFCQFNNRYKPQQAFNMFLKTIGVQLAMDVPEIYDNILILIERYSNSRQVIYNRKKHLHELINSVKSIKENRKDIQFINLNNELRNKLLIA